MPPVSLLIDLLVQVVAPALAVSALSLFLTGRGRFRLAGPAVAFAAGFAAANWVRQAWPWWHEHSAWQWLPWAMLAGLIAAVLARLPALPDWAGWLVRVLAVALAAWLLVPTELRVEKAWWLAAFFAAVLANWVVLERSADRAAGWSVAIGLALVCAGGALVLVHSHTARLADLAFMAGAALAGITIVGWRRQLDIVTALAGPAVFLPGLMLSGHYETSDFSDVPAACFLLIGLTPLALLPGLLPPLAKLPNLRLALVRISLLLAPVAIAVALAMRAAPMQFE
jgi:hypothetical protein